MTYEEAVKLIPVGTYRHYKGSYYHVNFIASEADTQRAVVVYTHATSGSVYVRDAESWLKEVPIKRFELVVKEV